MLAADGADEPVMKKIRWIISRMGQWIDDLLFPEDVLTGGKDGPCP